MFNVFHNPTVGLLGHGHWEKKHLHPFEMYSEFQITADLNQAVIIPVVAMDPASQCKWLKTHFNKDQHWLLIMMHTHVYEGSDNPISYRYLIDSYTDAVPSNRILLAHTNIIPHGHISYNHMWDICKLYYTDYNKLDLSERMWSGTATADQYKLTDIPHCKNLEKIWVVPNRYPFDDISERYFWRYKMDKSIDHKTSVYGNPDNKQFIPGEGLSLAYHIGFLPIANQIYNTTLISAYTESITQTSQTRCITEKTYNPLIKGHFILPYGYSGLIQDIRKMGFLLPQWINYDYDLQYNDEIRWEQYIREYHRINSIPKVKLEKIYRKNKHILDHNRQLFFKKPYAGLPDLIAKYLGINS